jgi:hypothetical protein
MTALAFLTLLANGLVSVPPSHWTAIDVNIPHDGTIVDCWFKVVNGSRVQAILLDRQQAERFYRGRAIRPVHMTGFNDSGRFRLRLDDAGDYVLLIDNRIEGRTPTEVQVRVELLTPHSIFVRTAPPERRRAVVALSLLFFGSVLVFSARQYLRRNN